MSNAKTWMTWQRTRLWCLANPGKVAAVATPEGTFTITFTKLESELKDKS